MLRKFLGILVVLVLFTGILLADEAKGKFKKWEKGTITVKVGDKEVEYKTNKDCKILNGTEEVKGKARKDFFMNLKETADVTVTFTKEGDKVTVTEIKIKP